MLVSFLTARCQCSHARQLAVFDWTLRWAVMCAGVGISGQEGMQAAMAADFSIAQFRFLTPLLLVHGRLSYKRITRMISFFFYKNLFYGSTIFVYNAFALFSGQPIYNDFYMTLFNVVFSAAAPLVVGWFDRDLDKEVGLRFPFLYREGESFQCIGTLS